MHLDNGKEREERQPYLSPPFSSDCLPLPILFLSSPLFFSVERVPDSPGVIAIPLSGLGTAMSGGGVGEK